METINEVKLGRVLQHFNSEKTVVILTGFRGENTREENLKRNKTIGGKLKNAGFGYFYVDGYWIENKGTPNEIKVSEDSIFTISEPNTSKNLIELAHKLANEYDQDAIFVKSEEGVYLLYKNGEKEILDSKFKPNKIGDFYTQLRGKGKNSTFLFENYRTPDGFFASLVKKIESEKKDGR